MQLPDLIILEVLQYFSRSDLKKYITLNRTFKNLIVEAALASITLDDETIEFLKRNTMKRRIINATLFTDQISVVKIHCKQLKELTIGTPRIPKFDAYKLISGYESLRTLDLFFCDADPVIAFAIAQSRNLKFLRAPKFNLSKPLLLKFLGFLCIPSLSGLSLVADILDCKTLKAINKAGPKLNSLELLSSSAALDISEGLNCSWDFLSSLKVSVVDALPEGRPAIIVSSNFPRLACLFISFPYKFVFPEEVLSSFQCRWEFGLFKRRDVFLYDGIQVMRNMVSLGVDCKNLLPGVVKTILASSSTIKTLKLHRVGDKDLFSGQHSKQYCLVNFSLSSHLNIGQSALHWLSRNAPHIQHLSINCKLSKNHNFFNSIIQSLISLNTGNIVSLASTKSLVQCLPNLKILSIWNSRTEQEWVALFKLFGSLLVDTPKFSNFDDGFELNVFDGPCPLTFQPLSLLIGKRNKGDLQHSQSLYCPPIASICYDDLFD